MDGDSNDFTSNGFANCLTRDGQGSATANQPMNGFRHTNVGNGQIATDYLALGQYQSGEGINWSTDSGAADAIAVTYTPALASLTDGQLCFVRAANANATSTPTFAPNGLTAHTITKLGGAPLDVGDIPNTLAEIILRYNLANTRWELLNPAAIGVRPGTIVATARATADSGYLLCQGQSLLRASFPALFAAIGTTFGSADGSHFTLPDCRGRVLAQIDSGASARITVAGGNFDGTVLGGAGGLQNETLTQAQLPAVAPTFTGVLIHLGTISLNQNNILTSSVIAGSSLPAGSFTFSTTTPTVTIPDFTPSGTISNLGSGNAHPNVQPTILINYQIKT